MKQTIYVSIFCIASGVLLLFGSAEASPAEMLQPADEVVYNEDVTVNGTLRTDSIHVGEEGVGGVTFFNGSIVNVGADTPVTVADDLRVDGEIWRTEKGGANPVKISDHLIPTITNTNNLGSTSNRWASVYAQEGDYSDELTVNNVNLSSETPVYVSTDSDSNLTVPSPNPTAAHTEIGRITLSCPDGGTGPHKTISFERPFTSRDTYSFVAMPTYANTWITFAGVPPRADRVEVALKCEAGSHVPEPGGQVYYQAIGY